MKSLKLKLLILLNIGFLFSCAYHDIEPRKDVYVAGYSYLPGSQGGAAFWKNGTITQLPFGSGASAITVSGSDVYIAGSNNADVVYWKDTTLNVIPTSPHMYSVANAIAVSGKDVFLAGSEENPSDDNDNVVYWKNGQKTILENSPHYSQLTGIVVSGSDVHVAGYLVDSDWNVTAAYWKNGVKTTLSGPGAYVTGIALSGSAVYLSGVTATHVSYYFTGCYWKNGELVKLETPDGWSSEASAIAISGSDVYVSGTMYNYVNNSNTYAVVCWKNGVMTQLTDAYSNAGGTSIVVSGSDVYVSGWIINSNYESQAMYWKNGVPTVLGLGRANAILVK